MTSYGTTETGVAAPEVSRLIGEEECINALFSPESRPAPRTWRKWKKKRIIPYVKVGKMCFYDPEAVRAAIVKGFTVAPRV